MRVGVLANGEWEDHWGREELSQLDLLICADGGANRAFASNCSPDVVIGDLDSITPENLMRCQQNGIGIIRYPREKDETDLELALTYAFEQGNQSEVCLYGATGRRMDHFLGAIALMIKWACKGKKIILKDPLHDMWVAHTEENVEGDLGQQMSLIPLSAKAVVSLEGFYYPLQDSVLYQESPRGISNVFTAKEGIINVKEGLVLVTLLKGIE